MRETNVVIRGTGVVAEHDVDLRGLGPHGVARGCDDDALKAHIGKRGIRYKDRATRLALAAAKLAMQQAGLTVDGYQDLDDASCAVIVASCFGNVDTVLASAAQIAAEGSSVLSPMDLPNASANVVPATLAIWFGLRGPNLLVANGPGSGTDALLFASNMIRTGSVRRVLVCGTEARQPAIDPLFAQAGQAGREPADIAAAVVLERDEAAAAFPVRLALSGPGTPVLLEHAAGGARMDAAASPLAGAPVLARSHGAASILSVVSAWDALCKAAAPRPHTLCREAA